MQERAAAAAHKKAVAEKVSRDAQAELDAAVAEVEALQKKLLTAQKKLKTKQKKADEARKKAEYPGLRDIMFVHHGWPTEEMETKNFRDCKLMELDCDWSAFDDDTLKAGTECTALLPA